jgi:N-hydroxyarylamine O-acetyltransferase
VDRADFELAPYLDRIGLTGRPTIAQLHRCHVTSIPFENLDSHRGVRVSLEPGALQRKLVHDRRGGYCFEQNLLLAGALRALGAEVTPMLARVRYGRPPQTTSPRTHLVLRVGLESRVWLADAGFGNGTLLEPIPFGPGEEHVQSGWAFRLVADGREHLLQTRSDAGWTDLYAFVPEPVPSVDIETSNWFTCSHPGSPFVTGLIVSIQRRDGSRVALSDWTGPLALSESTPARRTATEVARERIPELLETRFGLRGFAVGADGRVTTRG